MKMMRTVAVLVALLGGCSTGGDDVTAPDAAEGADATVDADGYCGTGGPLCDAAPFTPMNCEDVCAGGPLSCIGECEACNNACEADDSDAGLCDKCCKDTEFAPSFPLCN